MVDEMTDFNALPLTEQLKHLQPGDELHLRGGGWLPFVKYRDASNYYKISSHKDEACNTLEWTQSGTYLCNSDDGFWKPHSVDIIRVVRHPARKVPEVVGELRRILREHDSPHNPLMEIVRALADHFERGEQP